MSRLTDEQLKAAYNAPNIGHLASLRTVADAAVAAYVKRKNIELPVAKTTPDIDFSDHREVITGCIKTLQEAKNLMAVFEASKAIPIHANPRMEQAAEKYWNNSNGFKGLLNRNPRTWAGVYHAMTREFMLQVAENPGCIR